MSEWTSEDLYQRSLRVAPGGVHSPVRAFKSVGGSPVFFRSAQGAYIKTVEGRELIDYCQSFGPNLLGHRDPDVQAAVEGMLNKVWTLGACEPYSLELAEWIKEQIPWLERLRFVNSGTEAVMSALRLARGATGRNKILKFEGCYHGHVDSMLVEAGSGLAGESASSSSGVGEEIAKTTLVARLGDREQVEQVFAAHGNEIAAVIIEPLPGNFGMLKQDEGFLKFLREVCNKNQSLLIFDEVISGFRVAMGGMAEITGVTPDLVTYGKIIGGGFPVGCYGGRQDLMEQMAPLGPVYQAGTLSANPICMAAGLATLKKAKECNVYELLEKRTAHLVSELQSVFDEANQQWCMVRQGSLFWMAYNVKQAPRQLKDIDSNQGEAFKGLFHELINNGIYFPPSGYELGFMSLAHNNDVIDTTVSVFREALKK